MGCQKNFTSMDKDGDGMVTREEFMAAPHRRDNPEEIFKAKDADGDGKLTKDEFCSGKGMGYGGKGKGATP
jgi:Ca2+-binding EF-hand superfamily protein